MKILLLIVLSIVVLGLNWFISHLTINATLKNEIVSPDEEHKLNKASRIFKGILCALLTICSITIGILI